LAIAAGLWFGTRFELYLADIIMIYAISTLALDWLMGRAGQVSFGNGALMAVGAYTTAGTAGLGWAVFPLPLLLSALAGAAVGLVVGLPALRLRGLYLVLSTLALQFIVAGGGDLFQGRVGALAGFPVPTPTVAGYTLEGPIPWTIVLVLILIAVMVGLSNMYRSAPGRAWQAIRESELAAAAIGVNVIRWKLTAFVASSALIASSGPLFAYYLHRADISTYSLDFALAFLVMEILGGVGSMRGVLMGTALVTLAPIGLQSAADALPGGLVTSGWLSTNIFYINEGFYGLILMAVLLYLPGGLASISPARLLRPHRDRRLIAAVEVATAPSDARELVLRTRELRVRYRTGASAVDGVSINVESGQIVALLGRNGAGKTSSLRALAGFFPTEGVNVGGEVWFAGKQIAGWNPYRVSTAGISLVQERDKVFPNLTVREHVAAISPRGKASDATLTLLEPLRPQWDSRAGLLSGGQRQLLALAIASSLRPRLLLVDELSLGLAPVVVDQLMKALRDINRRDGTSMLMVEQNPLAALSIADYGYVMDGGRVILEGSASKLRGDLNRQDAYLGIVGG